MTLPGLAGGTAISMTFFAKTFGSDGAAGGRPPDPCSSWLADANTSAGAPEVICVASAELAAKLNVTFTPGLAASNCLPSVVNDSVSDAAANTVIDPDNDGDAEPELLALDVAPAPEPLSVDPHPPSPTATRPVATKVAAHTTTHDVLSSVRSRRGEISESSGSPRRRWWP